MGICGEGSKSQVSLGMDDGFIGVRHWYVRRGGGTMLCTHCA